MKRFFLFIVLILLLADCQQTPSNTKVLQKQIDSLKQQIAESYKPGFGEFMSAIQVHHAKLWFAGQNHNWRLADFEIHEIKESLDDLQKYETDRPETETLPMIYPALDSVIAAVTRKDASGFKKSFSYLTNTCNNCHKAVHYDFNDVKIPDNPPFSNQVFKSEK